MSRVRAFLTVLWVAIALAVGQQAAALHDLEHLTERLASRKDSAPAPKPCDKHFLCAQLSSAAGATMPVLPVLALDEASVPALLSTSAPTPTRFAFRSRAPPTLL